MTGKNTLYLLLVGVTLFSCSSKIESRSSESLTLSIQLYSENLQENRSIEISLPRTYFYTDGTYPVLYVLDGEWIFSYASGIVSFMTNDLTGYIPEMIVVGISNTSRYRDMGVTLNPQDSYNDFMNFIENELITYIDSAYRTNDFRLIYGWSSGSAISDQFFYERPEIFKAYLNSGAGIGSRTYAYAGERLPNHTFSQTFYYANCEGDSPRRIQGLRLSESLLDSLSLDGVRTFFEVREDLTHLDVLADGVEEGLKFVFNDFRLTNSLIAKGADAILAHFEQLDTNYNYEVIMPEGAFVEAASLLQQSGQLEDAIEILQKGQEIHDYSADLHGTLGEIYFYENQLDLAKEQYELAVQKAENQQPTLLLKYQTLLKGLK